ncbi:MAG: lysozyme inhibitor LprI family protein, partial [Terriglobales bacterium]
SKILKEYADDQQFIAKLKTAQKAWLAFRDAELEALYPKDNKQAEYGTVYPMCHCSELQFLTEERTKQLNRWLDGTREGDVCAGSIKVAQRTESEINDQAIISKRQSD